VKFLGNPKVKKLLLIIAIILAVALVIYLVIHGYNFFTRRGVRQFQRFISSYGSWSPLVVIGLILLSTLIPPLPLPVPLIEMAAGLVLGFWPGFFVVWFSQITSSLAAFGFSRFFGKRLFGKVLNNKLWSVYQLYLNRKGPLAVFITRLAMAAPFNIISYTAGLTKMKVWSFTLATALGTIMEAALFTWVGSQLRSLHIPLKYLSILIIVLGVLGLVLTFALMKFVKPTLEKD
jgi:uncharacterized membrane protein YdjX (TVP38/TMEM64 family)